MPGPPQRASFVTIFAPGTSHRKPRSNATMKHLALILFAAASLTSCETTGDPTQGGLFGWSQGKADDRIYARERRLAELERENAYQSGRTEELEYQASKKKAQVNY